MSCIITVQFTCLCLIKLGDWYWDSLVSVMGEGGVSYTSHFTLPLLYFHSSFTPTVAPLQAQQFSGKLQFHPNRQQADFVLDGIRHGFKFGFSHTQQLKPAKKNKSSADQHASVINEYLTHEVFWGRVAGLFDSPPLLSLQVSSFGVIPKRGQVGKWRLIVDIHSPTGSSVNDGINPEEFTLHYIAVDQVIQLVSQFSAGA